MSFQPAIPVKVVALRDDRGVTYLAPLGGTIDVTSYEQADHVSAWFNRDKRSWVVAYSDETGNQAGRSEYCGNKDWALEAFADLWLNGTFNHRPF